MRLGPAGPRPDPRLMTGGSRTPSDSPVVRRVTSCQWPVIVELQVDSAPGGAQVPAPPSRQRSLPVTVQERGLDLRARATGRPPRPAVVHDY